MKKSINNIKINDRKRELSNISQLKDSISKIGLLNPITVNKDNVLIAGYHRLQACKELGFKEIECNMVDISSQNAELAEIDENLIRNELAVLQRSEQLLRRKEIYEELYPETKQGGDRKSKELKSKRQNVVLKSFTEDASNKLGVSERTIEREIQIAKKLDNEVKEQIKDTQLADNKIELLELARKKPEEQRKIVEKVISGKAKNIKEAISQEKRQERINKIIEISKGNKDLSDVKQKYSVILADPPWSYDFCKDSSDDIENHYPTMTLEDICKMPVPDICTPDSVLFLWVTAPKLIEAIEVIKAWGFMYKTNCVWDKEHIGMGYWFRGRHELLLVATKGNIPCPQFKPDSVYSEKRTQHSKKPDYYYEMIEKMFPELAKIELFARISNREDWHAWGNQANE